MWYCQFDVSPVNYSDSDSEKKEEHHKVESIYFEVKHLQNHREEGGGCHYENTPMKYTEIFKVVKNSNLKKKK